MKQYIPRTASARELQTCYRKLLNEVKATHEPIFIMSNNKKEAVLLDLDTYQMLCESHAKIEKEELLEAIREYEKDKAEGKLIKLDSLDDLIG
ncbi:type II toxin-antitoxin system Phd/YefM family antitoxin [Candidatus Peregrinibacteria bacterium]|jgi:PHD/YefM family antitoxin component YafN of YafNO toxin-antitoxin module|nr:type II toxin-antitoxin system Phd/YefM family antitoxin [Candidatus Peregrinibacteria bacterium]